MESSCIVYARSAIVQPRNKMLGRRMFMRGSLLKIKSLSANAMSSRYMILKQLSY